MWKNYGQKIISSLFKKWTDSTTVRVELESKVQADSDRSDIRVFEAGLPNEQYGDYEQSTRVAALEAEGARLIAIAKAIIKGLRAPDIEYPSYITYCFLIHVISLSVLARILVE